MYLYYLDIAGMIFLTHEYFRLTSKYKPKYVFLFLTATEFCFPYILK